MAGRLAAALRLSTALLILLFPLRSSALLILLLLLRSHALLILLRSLSLLLLALGLTAILILPAWALRPTVPGLRLGILCAPRRTLAVGSTLRLSRGLPSRVIAALHTAGALARSVGSASVRRHL